MPKRTNKHWVLAAVIMLLIFLHLTGVIKPLESIFITFTKPLSAAFYSLGSNLRIFYNKQTDKRDLAKLVEEQASQINQLVSENVKLKILEEENEKLRNYLSFFQKNKANYVMGNIISAGGQGEGLSRSQTVVIDKGSRDGLKPGLAVVSSQGMIVGKIAEVKNDISVVYLVTNPACKLASTILNNEKTMGIAEGELGLVVKMNFIPQNSTIDSSQIVITSGLEQSIPRGLVIGKVTQVSQVSNELWQNATIEPLVNLDNLIVLSVITP